MIPKMFTRCLAAAVFLAGVEGEAAESTVEQVAAASAVTPKAELFRAGEAKAIPTLAAGGFADLPSFEDHFLASWEQTQDAWRVATWKQNGTLMSPDRCRTDGQGHLVQTVLAGDPPRGGSLQTKREFGYGRWIARVKASAVPGLLNSIFTKDWDDLTTPGDDQDGLKAEVDIEFVTHTFGDNQGQVHLAIHLKDHDNFWHGNVPLDFNPSEDFHEWGFDILPDRVVWHVDGKVLQTWANTPEYLVHPGYEFFFNSWTQKSWLKGPPLQDGQYEIDWVKFYPLREK